MARPIITFLVSIIPLVLLGTMASAQCAFTTDGYQLDWNQSYASWPAGSLSQTITVPKVSGPGSSDVTIGFSGSTGYFNPGYPAVSNMVTGGQGSSNDSLLYVVNFDSTSRVLTLTMTFATPVENLDFSIYDIDDLGTFGGTGGFRDGLHVAGYDATTGQSAAPAFQSPWHSSGYNGNSTVYIEGAAGAGNLVGYLGNSGNTSNRGNIDVSFSQPVTQVTIDYGSNMFFNSSDPAQQGIAINDLKFCIPQGDVTTVKTQSLYSETPVGCGTIPGTPDPAAAFAAPGACIEYVITATNVGRRSARHMSISDVLNPNLTYRGATFSGFTSDGANYGLSTPPPGQDCAGGACAIVLNNARLYRGNTGTIKIRATLN